MQRCRRVPLDGANIAGLHGASAVDGMAQRIQHAALPTRVRGERDGTAQPRDLCAELYLGLSAERRDDDRLRVDGGDLAQCRRSARLEADAVAERHEARQSRNLQRARRDVDDLSGNGDEVVISKASRSAPQRPKFVDPELHYPVKEAIDETGPETGEVLSPRIAGGGAKAWPSGIFPDR
jgi:hypothetical protein